MNNLSEKHILIIGGTSKAGTTSLYSYLANHPQICASSIKETGFFLDASYPLSTKNKFSAGLEGYLDFFSHCGGTSESVYMEATPDYLYANNALRIADLLPKAKIIFILRDPIERLVSWFHYAKQRNFISSALSFEDYVLIQMQGGVNEKTPVHLRALEQGRYLPYLARFNEAMPERVFVASFEQLKTQPRELMVEISTFVGITPDYFDDFVFTVKNKSVTIKYPKLDDVIWKIKRKLINFFHNKPRLFSVLRKLNRYANRLMQLNVINDVEDVVLSDSLRTKLTEYYFAEIDFLKRAQNSPLECNRNKRTS